MSCYTGNIDLQVCINIIKDPRQDLVYAWKIEGMPVAEEFTLTLFGRSRTEKQTYTIKAIDDTLVWTAADADFDNSLMYYEMIPKNHTPVNWIKFHGQITIRK